MYRVSKNNLSYEMNKSVKPVLEVSLPASITFETIDAFGGQIKSEEDLIDALDFEKVNPATGSVSFKSIHNTPNLGTVCFLRPELKWI